MAGTAYVAGTLVQGLLILNYPGYDYQRWHGTLLFYAVLALSLFVNTYLGRLLPQIESIVLFFHIIGFFGILIPLVYLAPHQPANEVFTTFSNLGNWNTTALSFFVGLITAMNSFPGEFKTKRMLSFLLIRERQGLDAADHIGKHKLKQSVIRGAAKILYKNSGRNSECAKCHPSQYGYFYPTQRVPWLFYVDCPSLLHA